MNSVSKLRGAVPTLLTGTAFSQLVMVLASPFLARLYSPAVFGEYAILSLIVGLLVIFATGKYELAVLLQTDREKAWHVACFAMTTAAVVSTVFLVVGLGVVSTMPGILPEHFSLRRGDSFALISVCFLMVLLNASQTVLFALMNRNGQFSAMSISRISQAVMMVGSQMAFSVLKGGLQGLLWGSVVGLFSCALVQFFVAFRSNGLIFPNLKLMGDIAVANRNLPLHTIPTDLISALLAQFPVYFLAANFSVTSVGYFSLAQRTLQAPMQLIANSIGEVFRRNASSIYLERGECKLYFLKISRLLALIAVGAWTVTSIWAISLFSLIYGTQWEAAGRFAQILILMFALKFVVNPISFMFLIVKKTRLDLILHLIFMVSLIIAFSNLNIKHISVEIALWRFVIIYSVMYVVYFLFSYQFSRGSA